MAANPQRYCFNVSRVSAPFVSHLALFGSALGPSSSPVGGRRRWRQRAAPTRPGSRSAGRPRPGLARHTGRQRRLRSQPPPRPDAGRPRKGTMKEESETVQRAGGTPNGKRFDGRNGNGSGGDGDGPAAWVRAGRRDGLMARCGAEEGTGLGRTAVTGRKEGCWTVREERRGAVDFGRLVVLVTI